MMDVIQYVLIAAGFLFGLVLIGGLIWEMWTYRCRYCGGRLLHRQGCTGHYDA